jgi:hypothetical protein
MMTFVAEVCGAIPAEHQPGHSEQVYPVAAGEGGVLCCLSWTPAFVHAISYCSTNRMLPSLSVKPSVTSSLLGGFQTISPASEAGGGPGLIAPEIKLPRRKHSRCFTGVGSAAGWVSCVSHFDLTPWIKMQAGSIFFLLQDQEAIFPLFRSVL